MKAKLSKHGGIVITAESEIQNDILLAMFDIGEVKLFPKSCLYNKKGRRELWLGNNDIGLSIPKESEVKQ